MNCQLKNPKSEIRNPKSERGFSLTEVLLAVGTLAVGMLFIAGVFPVSVHFTTVAAERTIAATVADEAFAKIKLYGISDANWIAGGQTPFELVAAVRPATDEFAYPSIPTTDPALKRYWWSAICRRVGPADVQVTVFVSRKTGVMNTYFGGSTRPVIVQIPVILSGSDLQITNPSYKSLINDGYTIVDDSSGRIYRVLERYGGGLDLLRLNETLQGGVTSVWVVPPPVGGGRYPCIAVYQKVMRF